MTGRRIWRRVLALLLGVRRVEERDPRWFGVYDAARADGVMEDRAREIADRACREQDQPTEETHR